MSEAIHPTEQEEVMAYLDGELSADRAAAMVAHLRECADCESLAAGLRSISRQVAAWTVDPAPKQIETEVLTAVRRHYEEAKGRPKDLKLPASWLRTRWSFGPFGWAFASGVVVLLAVTFAVISLHLRREALPSSARNLSAMRVELSPPRTKLEKKRPAGGGGGGEYEELFSGEGSIGRLPSADSDGPYQAQSEHTAVTDSANGQLAAAEPLIARTASLTLVVKDFGPIEASVKAIAERYRGYIANLNTTSPQNAAREFTATLRIPAGQLEAAIADLKQLGRVERQQQSGEDVTKQYTDVAAHLKNSRITEQRLLDVLRDRTGKMKDILETEQEIERVRGEIEELESAQRGLQKRIEFATVQLSVSENYKASLEVAPPSTGTRFHNAAVSGLRSVMDGTIGFALWLLEAGPGLLLWAALLFFPARWAWRRWRRLLLEGAAAVPQQ